MENYKQKYEQAFKKAEDERIRKELINAFTVTADKREHEIYGNGITYRQVLDWFEKQGEQKPTWSEEDEMKMDTLIHVITNQKGSAIFEGLLPEELVNWLKSIKERMKGE